MSNGLWARFWKRTVMLAQLNGILTRRVAFLRGLRPLEHGQEERVVRVLAKSVAQDAEAS